MRLNFDSNLEFQTAAIAAVCDLFRGQEACLEPSVRPTHNRLMLTDAEVHQNLMAVQIRNGLPPAPALNSGDFTIEMETGTGKTYVYLRTIFELNKRFGFTKFIVVVPSIAIKEGVYKTLQITADHFRALYPAAAPEYFLYDSAQPASVRNFARETGIQVMIVTAAAINKRDVNNLYKEHEQTGGAKPIDLIRSTCPILIIDEPQSVDGGLHGRGKAALEAMNPLCTLRYSATHVDAHQMIYRLDAVEAYQRQLVKSIEVAAAAAAAHQGPFVRLVAASQGRRAISARVELDIEQAGRVARRTVTVQDGDDLQQITGRSLYAGYGIGEIRVAKGSESLRLYLPGDTHRLGVGEAWGDLDLPQLHREMIRRTIFEHLEKEKKLLPRGIKVLSLFFIDEVARYRQYDADGRPIKGLYAEIFEAEYARATAGSAAAAAAAHNGYFSIDPKGRWTDTSEARQTGAHEAQRAYTLIMQDKEKLLSLDTPLKFIFSHSALREGWDNPNIFQICVLRDVHTWRERRQTIGRGLRLCVNQEGQRVQDPSVNTLTVIARESYEEFAENLQREIETDIGRRLTGELQIGNADARPSAAAAKTPIHNHEFQLLWNKITGRTNYQVEFDSEALINACIAALRAAPPLPKPHLRWRKANIAIGRGGVGITPQSETESDTVAPATDADLPGIITKIEEHTRLTRRSIARILAAGTAPDDGRQNPQGLIERAAAIINRCKLAAIGDGVKYVGIEGGGPYTQQLFTAGELARQSERDAAATIYEPLPPGFAVPTPLGKFSPVRAVLVRSGPAQTLYFSRRG